MIPAQPLQRPSGDAAKSRIQRALKLSQLFERASRSTRELVLAAADVDVVAGGTPIFAQGSPSQALLVIGRGRARLERAAPDGRVVPLGYRGSGEVLGEAGLGHLKVYTENATAMEETEIVRVPLAVVEELSASDPGVAPAIHALLLQRQRETEDCIESLLFRNVEGRVVEFLLGAAERWGVPSPKGTLISAPITHLEIAQSVGSTRETVTLTLGALRKEGLLDVAGRRLIVKNHEGLARKAGL